MECSLAFRLSLAFGCSRLKKKCRFKERKETQLPKKSWLYMESLKSFAKYNFIQLSFFMDLVKNRSRKWTLEREPNQDNYRILTRNQMRSTISDDMTNTSSGLGVGHVSQIAL